MISKYSHHRYKSKIIVTSKNILNSAVLVPATAHRRNVNMRSDMCCFFQNILSNILPVSYNKQCNSMSTINQYARKQYKLTLPILIELHGIPRGRGWSDGGGVRGWGSMWFGLQASYTELIKMLKHNTLTKPCTLEPWMYHNQAAKLELNLKLKRDRSAYC